MRFCECGSPKLSPTLHRLPCSFYVYTILASYIIQSEAGDYDPQNHRGIDYIKNQALAPQKFQTPEFMEKVVALHKLHRGQTPEEADKNFLDNTRKLSLYGLDMHKVKVGFAVLLEDGGD